jgi:glycine/D-amino acid oxidase-like deaminating enzyme
MASANDLDNQYVRTSGATTAVWTHKDKFDNHPKFSALQQDLETDVCVIGAGIAGISIAYELVSRGKQVVLVEARDVLSGETGRTSGHLANALDDHYIHIASKHGKDGAKAAAESHTWALRHVGEIAEKLNIDCEYRLVPGYEISQYETTQKEYADDIREIQKEAALANELGLGAEYRNDLKVKGWDGKPDQRGGAVFPKQAAFHPTIYLSGILKWLGEQPNFKAFTHTRVMSVEEKSSEGVTVQTKEGRNIRAKQAVEATCVPLQKLAVIAQMEYNRTYCIAIRVPKGSVEDCFLYDSAEEYKYVRLTACDDKDDYMIVGGCDHAVGQEGPEGRYEELEQWTRERFTQAGAVDFKWSGQIYDPVDFMGYIGKNQGNDNIYIVTGDSGNGLTHGVLAGRLIADEIEGRENPWAHLYSPKRVMPVLKSGPSMIKHDLQVNAQYKKIAQPDITDIEDLAPGTGGVIKGGPLSPSPWFPLSVILSGLPCETHPFMPCPR